jgi:hypothetical protein
MSFGLYKMKKFFVSVIVSIWLIYIFFYLFILFSVLEINFFKPVHQLPKYRPPAQVNLSISDFNKRCLPIYAFANECRSMLAEASCSAFVLIRKEEFASEKYILSAMDNSCTHSPQFCAAIECDRIKNRYRITFLNN